MAYFAIVTSAYPSNPRNPVVGVWPEVSGGGVLPGGHDKDAGLGRVVSQVGRTAGEENAHSSPTANSC